MNKEISIESINGSDTINEEKQMNLDELWKLVEKMNWHNI